jgi:fibronectin type 3 domain-containing protein
VVITATNRGAWNAVISGLFLGDGSTPASVPGAPTNLAATRGNAQVALTWQAPASNGGSPITSYTATASPGGASCTTATLGCTITGLTNGTTYSFTVTARNAVGTGPASSAVSATPATVPGAPTAVVAAPASGQLAISWSAPASNGGSAITSYTATAGPDGATCSSATLGCTITGLTNGITYTVTVTATSALGTGPGSVPVSGTPATVPVVPTNLVATRGNAQLALTWSAPAANGGSPITSYMATASPGGASCTTATLGCTITGLTNGTTYSITVRATNAVGSGPASSPVSATPATVPGAPPGLTANALRTGGIQLTWSAPPSNGSSIIGYRIYRSTSSGTQVFYVAVGNVTTYTDVAVTKGLRYFYKVAAVNAVGIGALSTEAQARAR